MKRSLALLLCSSIALVGCESSTGPGDGDTTVMSLVAADRDGHIYLVNETTGADELFTMTTFTPAGGVAGDVGVVSSMAWIPSTETWLLGTGGNAECDACLLTLDPGTGVATLLWDLGADLSGVSGLAVHPDTEALYSFYSDSSGDLLEIDLSDGSVNEIMATAEGSSGKGTTFSSTGLLYVAGDEDLTEIDIGGMSANTTAFSFVGFPAFTGGSQTIGSMATRADGVIFGILKDGGGVGSTTTTYLVTIDPETAVVTNVGANSGILDGLAYIPSALLVD